MILKSSSLTAARS